MTPKFYEGIAWKREPSSYLGIPRQYHKNSNVYWSDFATNLRDKSSKWARNELSIFAGTTVCNAFLVAKLWYVMNVLHCSRVNIQRLHRVFALFIWMSNGELMRQDNLF